MSCFGQALVTGLQSRTPVYTGGVSFPSSSSSTAMANFLITDAGTTSQGTSSADHFSLNTALTTTVFGAEGADTVSAGGAIRHKARLNAGLGADTISLTAGVPTLTVAQVFAGGDNDQIAIDGAVAANSTINGGGGADTLQLSAAFTPPPPSTPMVVMTT